MNWTKDKFNFLLKKYRHIDCVFEEDLGCIAWRFATGGNVEIVEIEAATIGKGLGKTLLISMLDKLAKESTTVHNIISYRRTTNSAAENFYRKLGFQQIDLGKSLYQQGATTLVWISKEVLEINLTTKE